MYPTVSETRFGGGGSSGGVFHYNSFPLAGNGHRSLSEEEQHLYNHHIIENFVESVREMNDVVLIPSKLKDLDQTPPTTGNYVALNDDLYSYYQMINVVKNDLFEPHNNESKKSMFNVPKRKISRREQTMNGHTRNVSSSNLAALLGNNHTNGTQPSQENGSTLNGSSSSSSIVSNGATNGQVSGHSRSNSGSGLQSPTTLTPLTSEQLVGQNSKQLTVQFIHHLHSLYTILEHFTNAADFITERYQKEVELAI